MSKEKEMEMPKKEEMKAEKKAGLVMNRKVIHDGVVYEKDEAAPADAAVLKFFKEQGFVS